VTDSCLDTTGEISLSWTDEENLTAGGASGAPSLFLLPLGNFSIAPFVLSVVVEDGSFQDGSWDA
jgi:hypothetical protein